MRILLVGGTGFIGPHIVRRLVEMGHEVTVFHRGESRAELPEGVNEIHGDRRELPSFAAEFRAAAPDVVLHMIAYTEEDARSLVSVFKTVARRAVVLSSADVYGAYGRLLRLESGAPAAHPLAEDAPVRANLYPYRARAEGPDDFKYDYEKILVERVVMNDAALPGTVLRLPAVYGPGDRQHRLFGYVKRMDDGRPFIMLGEAQAQWRWTRGYVSNVADAIALAVTNENAAGRIYNVGEADALYENQWVHILGRAAGWDGRVVTVPEDLLPAHIASPVDYDHDLATDTGRIRNELGYSERVPREEALRQTIEWERANPPAESGSLETEYAAEDAALEAWSTR
ncbi:MAG TPA: NAD-dependent epimerase/dehydratase family protein [Pyrinomonadaceae bacterium]|nr:NAD-dependent epimerase/dehydratase family protein [Pyrinomonadaceae bacterium]